MAENINIAITFRLDDELVETIKAVDPRIRILDFPAQTLGPGMDLNAEEQAQAMRVMADAEILYGSSFMPLDYVNAAHNLKWMQVINAGVDRMAKDGLLERGFVVTNVSGLAAPPIAEYVMATMLMLAKGLHVYVRKQAAHEWKFQFSSELRGKTCGIIGMGAIGRETAKRARAFGMRVIATRRTVTPGDTDPDCDEMYPYTDLDRVLTESDFVVVCVPLTVETTGMLGAAELAKMKRTASFINIARGAVVDQEALIAALRDGTIASAALDVVEPEPLPADSPLWDMENVILTPHISGAVERYGHRATEMFVRNLNRYVTGEELENLVDPVLAY